MRSPAASASAVRLRTSATAPSPGSCRSAGRSAAAAARWTGSSERSTAPQSAASISPRPSARQARRSASMPGQLLRRHGEGWPAEVELRAEPVGRDVRHGADHRGRIERRGGRFARGVGHGIAGSDAARREQLAHAPTERPARAFRVAAHAEIDAGVHPVEGLDVGQRLEGDVHRAASAGRGSAGGPSAESAGRGRAASRRRSRASRRALPGRGAARRRRRGPARRRRRRRCRRRQSRRPARCVR